MERRILLSAALVVLAFIAGLLVAPRERPFSLIKFETYSSGTQDVVYVLDRRTGQIHIHATSRDGEKRFISVF